MRQRLHAAARAARPRAPGARTTGWARSACSCSCSSSTFPVVIPFIFMHERRAGPARLQRHRHRDAVRDGLRVRTHDRDAGRGWWGSRWSSSEPFSWPSPWRWEDRHVRRLRRSSAIVDRSRGRRRLGPGDAERVSPSRRRPTGHVCAAERGREGVVLLRLGLHLPRARRRGLRAAHRSRRTAAGCTSKRATTTRTSTPARRGSATTSAAARRWRGNSRRCSAACSATPTASRRATRARWAGGSSNSTARASTSSTPTASSDSFFYNWSELSVSPVDWFRFGAVGRSGPRSPTGVRRGARRSARLRVQERRPHRLRLRPGRERPRGGGAPA